MNSILWVVPLAMFLLDSPWQGLSCFSCSSSSTSLPSLVEGNVLKMWPLPSDAGDNRPKSNRSVYPILIISRKILFIKTILCPGMASVSTPESMYHQVFEILDLYTAYNSTSSIGVKFHLSKGVQSCQFIFIQRDPPENGLTLATLVGQDIREK